MISWLHNAPISRKLAGIGLLSIVALSAITALAVNGFKETRNGLDAIEKSRVSMDTANAAEIGSKEIGVTIRNMLLAQTQEDSTKAAEASLR